MKKVMPDFPAAFSRVRMNRWRSLRWLPALFAVLFLLAPPACARNQAFSPPEMAQMLPVAYYDCIQITPYDLIWSYFDPYGHRWRANEMFTDKVVVFKDVEVNQRMLDTRGENYIWCDQVRCYTAVPEEIDRIKKLKLGQKIDVVGMMRGVDDDSEYLNTIKMTECYFSNAGVWAIPQGGGGTFTPGY